MRIRFFGLLVAGCCSSLLMMTALWLSRADVPPEARTLEEWKTLLQSPDASVRADAVREASRVAAMPALSCDLMLAGLSDVAAVRIQSVVLLAKVASRGRCIDRIVDARATAADPRSRAAAAEVLRRSGRSETF